MGDTQELLEQVEEKAGEKLGVERWDRPGIFREAAGAATDSDLPYWLVLVLSGAIATLGLAIDSSAVVIGAMLIAPLLSPVLGLALALAVGDGRLALQTGAVVLASTAAVMLAGAVLTGILPFHTITPEISARTQPTTLDLAIAVCSGMAGAVVTVARGKRLSAAIPGVAISVALIPPLAVAGFGLGSGPNLEVIRGSLLLYGANLAGIVLSGMAVFMLIGMHRPAVMEAAREYHSAGEPTGLAAWVDRAPGVRTLGAIRSPYARVGLVVAFVVALSFPLSETLGEIARETRVRGAVEDASAVFRVPGRSSVLGRQIVPVEGSTQVYLRVATAEWFGAAETEEFERRASARAQEPVRLVLEQLPASAGDVEGLAGLLGTASPRPAMPPPPPSPTLLPNLLAEVRMRTRRAVEALPLPDGVVIADAEVATRDGGESVLSLTYRSALPLPPEAEQILARQLAAALSAPDLAVQLIHLLPLPATEEPEPEEGEGRT